MKHGHRLSHLSCCSQGRQNRQIQAARCRISPDQGSIPPHKAPQVIREGEVGTLEPPAPRTRHLSPRALRKDPPHDHPRPSHGQHQG